MGRKLSYKTHLIITVEKIWKSIRSPKWFAMLLFMSRIRETSLNLELFTFVEIRKIIKKMISWATGTRDLPFLGFGGLEIDCRTFQPGAFSTPKFKPKSFNPRFFFIINMGRGWKVRGRIELVSKEINHFGGITSFFRDWAPGILTGDDKTLLMRHLCPISERRHNPPTLI